jgi:hypothetical protein
MNNSRVLVDAKYEERVRIKHLSMEPPLQGAKAQFEFENHRVEIALPKLPPEHKRILADPNAEAEADVWKNGEIIDIYIYFISITVMSLQFELPAAAAKHPTINAALYTEKETRTLDEKSNQLYFLGRRAVDYFLRVVRWKTGLAHIALDTRPDRATMRGGRLFNLSQGSPFYSPAIGRISVAPQRHRLNTPEWKDIEETLSAGIQPPVWNEFFASAQRRIDMNDLRAGTIDLAIAAESIIRQFPRVSIKARKKTTMSKLFEDWTKLGFPAVSHLPWFARLDVLFKVRNKIMHSGDDQAIKISFCRDAVIAVERLIATLAV